MRAERSGKLLYQLIAKRLLLVTFSLAIGYERRSACLGFLLGSRRHVLVAKIPADSHHRSDQYRYAVSCPPRAQSRCLFFIAEII